MYGSLQPARQVFWNKTLSYYDTFALKSALESHLRRPTIP
jgi:hypothetical protein